jgi:hypothetical protein
MPHQPSVDVVNRVAPRASRRAVDVAALPFATHHEAADDAHKSRPYRAPPQVRKHAGYAAKDHFASLAQPESGSSHIGHYFVANKFAGRSSASHAHEYFQQPDALDAHMAGAGVERGFWPAQQRRVSFAPREPVPPERVAMWQQRRDDVARERSNHAAQGAGVVRAPWE